MIYPRDAHVHADMAGWHPQIVTDVRELQPGKKFVVYRCLGMGAGEILSGTVIEIVTENTEHTMDNVHIFDVLGHFEGPTQYSDRTTYDPPVQTSITVSENADTLWNQYPLYANLFLLNFTVDFEEIIDALKFPRQISKPAS